MKERHIECSDLLYALADTTQDFIVVLDTDYCINFYNTLYKDAMKNNFGVEISLGDHLPSLISHLAEENRNKYNSLQAWQSALKGEHSTLLYETSRSGSSFYYELYYKPVINKDKIVTGALQITRDVTKLRNIEKKAEINNKFFILANSLPQIIWTATPDGLLDYFNDQWYQYSGLDYSSSMGQGWSSSIHPDDLPNLVEIWTHCLITGNNYYVQARVKAASGVYRWLLIRALPFRNDRGDIIHWFGTCTDIEEQKESELQLKRISKDLTIANEQIQLRNKRLIKINSDLDNFVYTASHDLKGPINNIEGLVNSLFENLEADTMDKEDSVTLLKLVDQSIERFKNTINEMAEVAKVQNEEIEDEEDILFEELLKEVQQTLYGIIAKYNAIIRADFSNAPSIRFSTKNLRSIYYNLVSNAIKYSAPERIPLVEITTEYENNWIVLKVKDNGLGIKDQDKEKVFKIFKRLHLHVEGSGVGMAIVKRIVDNVEGKIEIESEVNKGTVFKIYFPVNNL